MFSIAGPGFLVLVALLVPLWYAAPARQRWLVMLAAGTVFYLSLDLPGFFVLLASALAVWLCAARAAGQRLWLWLGLAAALGPLLFKYYGPLAAWLNTTCGLRLWSGQGLLIPFGLSYFALQLISYLLDVCRGRLQPEKNFARLFCFASFFLSVTQGPFNRYDELMPQLEAAPAWQASRLAFGAQRMAWGYFKKLAIAERAALVASAAFSAPERMDSSQLLFAAVIYCFQMYADFSGYTDIVLGVGEMLGLSLPENFRQPFLAASVREFWSRWHMSLSRWLRDYVYIPLGGSRRGQVRRVCNLILTFLISGLWHGAGVTYLVWGLLQALLQLSEGALFGRRQPPAGAARALHVAGTFAAFTATMVVFRSPSLTAAGRYFVCLLQNRGTRVFANYWELGLTSRLELVLLLAGVALLVLVDALQAAGVPLRRRLAAAPLPLRWAVYQGAIFAFLLMGRFLNTGGFLYARF